ncbi:ATP-binding protein [Archangium primigenium]|uniref:ATP-binding protein n=1 Tax=[Archangium] primigenium TaxID=2792470 RepID=UPI00195B0CF1|nr:histidine kinase [Archangium primigenium]
MNARVLRWSAVSMLTVEALMLASVWGDWGRMGALLGLLGVRVTGNLWVLVWARWTGRPDAGLIIAMVVNMVVTLMEARQLEWSLLAWLHVLFQVAFVNGLEERDHRREHRLAIALYLPVVAGWALHDGVEPVTVGTVSLLACLLYGYGEASHQMLLAALEDSRTHLDKLQRTQERLLEQETFSSLGRLAAGVAHEINNPMAYVTSNIRGLCRDLSAQSQALPGALREYVDEVLPETLDGIHRVNAIMADLRRFAQGDLEAPVEFDLNREVASVLDHSRGELEGRGHVVLDLSDLPPLVGRPHQIGQVIENLLDNAAQALPQHGGVVEVRTRFEHDEALVEVRDNGVGMSPEVRRSIFQPFFTTRPVGQGTGLGLAVAYGIVTGHGGRIDVESAPAQGTCVTVRLPARTPPPEARSTH